ncbi:hypothetical protein ACI1US_00772 [Leucobacter sp. BZR 635]
MPDPAPDATTVATPGWWTRLSRWVQRIPTGWFASILTGVFLAVTAAFGGLAPVAEAAVESLEPGEARVGPQLSVAVERAVVFDSFPQAGAYAGEGERVLALLVTVENRWSEPLLASAGAVEQALRVEGLGALGEGSGDGPGEAPDDPAPTAIARLDDATLGPWLQPGVPADLVVTWVVPEASARVGETISVVIREAKLERGQRLTSDERWTSPSEVATVTLETIAGGSDEPEAEPEPEPEPEPESEAGA